MAKKSIKKLLEEVSDVLSGETSDKPFDLVDRDVEDSHSDTEEITWKDEIDAIIRALRTASDEQLIAIADVLLGGIHMTKGSEDDEEDEDSSESYGDGEYDGITLGVFLDTSEAAHLVAAKKKPGQLTFDLKTGKIKHGPKHKKRMTGQEAKKAAKRLRVLMRSGKFRAELKKSLKKLRKSAKYKAFMKKVHKAHAKMNKGKKSSKSKKA